MTRVTLQNVFNWRRIQVSAAYTIISAEAALLCIRHLSPPSGSRGVRWAGCGPFAVVPL